MFSIIRDMLPVLADLLKSMKSSLIIKRADIYINYRMVIIRERLEGTKKYIYFPIRNEKLLKFSFLYFS